MSFTAAPATPTKAWLYIDTPYTDGLINDSQKTNSLFCYAKSQGYTGIIMYQMSNWVVGNPLNGLVDTNGWNAFIGFFQTQGIEIAAAFGGEYTALAVLSHNKNNPLYQFTHIVSEIEWWNYSHNMPIQQPVSGAYSYVETCKIFEAIKGYRDFLGLSTKISAYLGFTKEVAIDPLNPTFPTGAGDVYDVGFRIIQVIDPTAANYANSFVISDDWTGPTGLSGGQRFKAGMKIKVQNYPLSGNTNIYTIQSVSPYNGNTAIAVTAATPLTAPLPTTGSYPRVLNEFAFATSGPLQAIAIKGDQTWYLGSNGYLPTAKVSVNGSLYPSLNNQWDTLYNNGNNVSYDGINDITIIGFPFGPTIPGTDTTYSSWISFDVTYGYTTQVAGGAGPYYYGSEITGLYSFVDEFWLHDAISYANGTPDYGYVQGRCKTLARELNQYNGVLTGSIPVFFIVYAGSTYSQKFFLGANAAGSVIYPKKNVINAYKYIVTQITSNNPAQVNASIYAKAETDAYVNSLLEVGGIVLFKDTNLRGTYATNSFMIQAGDGPDMVINWAPDVYITANSYPGAFQTNAEFCDDCLPQTAPGFTFATYTTTYLLTNKPVGSTATINYTTVIQSAAQSTDPSVNFPPNQAAKFLQNLNTVICTLNYDLEGDYVIQLSIADGPNGITKTVNQTVHVRSAIVPNFDIVSVIQDTPYWCPNYTVNGGPTGLIFVTTSGSYNTPINYTIYGPGGRTLFQGTTGLDPGPIFALGPFLWPDVTINGYGPYTVEMTDDSGNGTTVTFDFYIQTYEPVAGDMQALDCDCSGSNGYAEFTLTGPNDCLPVSYMWDSNPSLNTNILSGANATVGLHKLEVTTFCGCTEVFYALIEGLTAWDVNYFVQTNTCSNGSNGIIAVEVIEGGCGKGGGPYTYSWSHNPGLNSVQATGLATGLYTCTITDPCGCTYTTPQIYVGYKKESPTFTITGPTEVCNTSPCKLINCQAVYTVTSISGGAAPYTYLWNDGQTTNPADLIAYLAGQGQGFSQVSCTVTDSIGCSNTVYYPVTIISWQYVPILEITGDTPLLTCFGSQQTIDVINPSGLNQSFTWRDENLNLQGMAGTSMDIDAAWWNLYFPSWTNGTYSNGVVVAWTSENASNPCVSVGTIVLFPPESVKLVVTYLQPNPCGGPGNQGEIDVEVLDGCPPFTYSWTGPNGFTANTQDISGLPNGDYFVTVTDSNTPTPNETTLGPITMYTSYTQLAANVGSAGCRPQTNGYIEVTASGGSAPYSFLWSTGDTKSSIYNLAPGVYTVTVTDDLGCVVQQSFTISWDSSINASISGSSPTAVDANNGTATAIGTGGTQPYEYLWSNGETTQTITDLDYGTYTVSIMSANGCVDYASITFVSTIIDHPIVNTGSVARLKCCAASIAYQYVKQRRNGQWEKAKCTMDNLMLMIGYINDMCNFMDGGCLTKEDIRIIAEKANQMCGCCGCSQNPYDDTL